MALAEFHSIKAAMTDDVDVRRNNIAIMNATVDRAIVLGAARSYPFIDRLETTRAELSDRSSYNSGLGLGRFPMPVYANRDNCALCHVGAEASAFGQSLDDPFQ